MNKIIIQDEISITQKDVDNVIKRYDGKSNDFGMGIGGWSGRKRDIIREVKNISDIGKQILMMDYRFNEWKKSDEYKQMEKEAKNKK